MFSPEQVLVHGGAMSLGPLKDSAPAILDCFYGGEEAAQAMADVLFGDYNPSGEHRSWPRRCHVVVTRPYVNVLELACVCSIIAIALSSSGRH
jgi:hypothetical protein